MASSRNPLLRLYHMRDEIAGMTAALRGADLAQFRSSYLLQRASERALLIISEAAKALPDDVLAARPDIDWPAIRALGNVLRHDYHMVDVDTLWEILSAKLPELAEAVAELIQRQAR